jgi:DNA-binding CsgD family transcriptional regulator
MWAVTPRGEARRTDRFGLTRREAEVLEALGERLTNAEIAARLYLSERTVESHVASLLRKVGARNRVEAGDLARSQAAEPPGGATRRLPAAFDLAADRASFVGRDVELARLQDCWDLAATGQVLVAIVSGEPGIGKSRLVAELATDVHRSGGRVLLGACFEDVQRPFEPFVLGITADANGLTDDELRRRVPAKQRIMARVVPTLAARFGVHDELEAADPLLGVGEVHCLLHEYLSRSARIDGPLLFVIEDAHWASATTRGALRYLARAGGDAPLLVVLTTRDTPPDLDAGLATFLAEVGREPTASHLSLGGLDVGSVAAILDAAGSEIDAADVTELTGGNPLYAREMAVGSGGIPPSVRALLARRFELLDDDDLAVVDLAAVLGFDFQADVLSAAAHCPLIDVLESLERIEATGLVAAAPGQRGWFSFAHALLRAARYDDLPARRRLSLHQEVADALVARAADSRVLPDLARHACIAAPIGDARAAIDYAVRAGDAAERSYAVDEASAHYRRALEVVDLLDPLDPAVRLQVATRLGAALRGAGDPEWRAVLLDAAELARRSDDAAALAEISWAVARYGGPESPSTVPVFLALSQEALDGIGAAPTAQRARTLAALSIQVDFTDPSRSLQMVEEARDIARRLDDPLTLGHVLLSYRYYARTPDNDEARHPTSDELIEIGHRTGESIFTICGLHNRVWSFRDQGALDAANRTTEQIESRVDEAALPPLYLAGLQLLRASRSALAGDLADAERYAESVWALAGDELDAPTVVMPALIVIRHQQGRLAEFLPLLEVASQQPGFGGVAEAALALAYANDGRAADAAAVLDRLVDVDFSAFPRNLLWLPTLVMLADAAEGAGGASGAAGAAAGQRIGELLEPYSGRIANLPQAVFGPIDLALAQAARAAGDHERAERFAAKAAAASRHRRTPILLARELLRLAAARRALGSAAADVDRDVAEALSIADRTGAALVHQDHERLHL